LYATGPSVFAARWPAGTTDALPPPVSDLAPLLGGWTVIRGNGWQVAAGAADCICEAGDWVIASPVRRLIDRQHGRLISLADLAAALERHGLPALDDLAPPYRLLIANRTTNALAACCDEFGLGHLFEAEQDGCRFYASSASLVARAIKAPPDRAALIGYAQLGVFAFAATPYQGVTKLPPPDPWARQFEASVGSGASLAGDIAESFRNAVQAMLAAAPDAAIELSGGLDSRLILAAMSPEQRRGRRALTLSSPGDDSSDVIIARRIAAANGLAHVIKEAPADQWADPDTLFATLDQASAGYNCMGNPVDKASLLANGEDGDGLIRFSGQNGEILRGFYHPMQPLSAQASDNLRKGLVNWRLIANDRVPDRLFSREIVEGLIPDSRDHLVAQLAEFDGEWGQALDRIYLRLRMQGWVGNAASSSLVLRTPLMPFFDRDFIKAALALPASARSNSQAAYRLLAALDPALAAIPLDNDVVPAAVLRPRLSNSISGAFTKLGKLSRKVWQRLSPHPNPVMGSAAVTAAWHRHKGWEQLDFDRLAALGLFDPAALDLLRTGQLQPNRSELGFLLICNAL
jgi:asparagine synthase (glutamine-hydrolysing)